MIQYATEYIDIEAQKRALLHASEVVRDKVGENLENVNTALSKIRPLVPIKEIIDQHTSDIKVPAQLFVISHLSQLESKPS